MDEMVELSMECLYGTNFECLFGNYANFNGIVKMSLKVSKRENGSGGRS